MKVKYNFHSSFNERKKARDGEGVIPCFVLESEYGEYVTAEGKMPGELVFNATSDINEAWVGTQGTMEKYEEKVLHGLDMTMGPLYVGRVDSSTADRISKGSPTAYKDIKDQLMF
jgi:hypothetical protein